MSASDRSRVSFEVRKTIGRRVAAIVPSSGIVDLEVGQDLEHQRLGLDLDAVDLVDQEHDRLVGADRRQQRPGQQERLGEDVLLELGPGLAPLVGLDAEELLLVVPLVERLGFRRAPRSTAAG